MGEVVKETGGVATVATPRPDVGIGSDRALSSNPTGCPGQPVEAADTPESQDLPGVIGALGVLPPGAIVTDEGLARIFKRHRLSILRAARRGEFPQPFRLLGANSWTVGALLAHFEKQQAERQKAREAMLKKISHFSS